MGVPIGLIVERAVISYTGQTAAGLAIPDGSFDVLIPAAYVALCSPASPLPLWFRAGQRGARSNARRSVLQAAKPDVRSRLLRVAPGTFTGYRRTVPDPIPFARVLLTAQTELDRLAIGLDVPIEGRDVPCVTVLAVARQAWVVYGGLRREALADRLGINGLILLRSLAEAAILVRWIQDSSGLRADMYAAEDYRQRLAAIDPFKEFRARRGGSGRLFSRAERMHMQDVINDVRTRARASGERIGEKGQLIPSVEEMARSTGDSAMWEAYEIIYRLSSQWTHLTGWSLAQHRIEKRPDGSHLAVAGPYPGVALRAMAATLMAHLLGSTSRVCKLGIETEARIWQDTIIEWPTPLIEEIRP